MAIDDRLRALSLDDATDNLWLPSAITDEAAGVVATTIGLPGPRGPLGHRSWNHSSDSWYLQRPTVVGMMRREDVDRLP
ncbi:MAG: hypothetical protein ICV75_07125 [Nitrospiraceae bacterium]|nr:hypothetical protein [Nitrospiraceae bacterium]